MYLKFCSIFVIILTLFSLNRISGQEVVFYGNRNLSQFISPQLLIYEDSNSIVSIANIINSDSIIFKNTTNPVPSYSFTKSTIWCRFKVNFKTSEDCFLEISPPILNEVTCYQVYPGEVDSLSLGSFHTQKRLNLPESNYYIFKLDPKANYYVLKIKSKTRLFIKASLATYEALLSKTKQRDELQSIYAGLLLMIFVYNLFLFISNGEKIYLYYLLHLINSFLYFLYMSGYGMEFIWTDFTQINAYFISIICFGFILTIVFVIKFLETNKNLPVLHYLLIGVTMVLALTGMTDIFGFSHFAGIFMNYTGVPVALLIITGAFIMAQKGFKPAYTFLGAWLLYIIGIAVQTLQSLNYIPTNEFTSNSIQIGSAFEIVLLSMAVGNKINFYKKKKLDAIKNEKILLEEKETLINNQKEELETRLQEATETLYAKNRELKIQNKEIKSQFDEISRQNRQLVEYHDLLETRNKIALKQKEELLNHVDNLEKFIEQRTNELKEASERAEESNQLKTAFLKDFSHEIRTPMNAISGFSNLLMDLEIDDKSHDYYVDIINVHTDNLLDLVDNIVDLSKIQTNQLFLKKVKFDPYKMFSSLFDRFSGKLKRERKSFIDLLPEFPADRDFRLFLDYNRFWKIVYQLIDNSLKYTESGFVQFGYKIKDNGNLEIFVKDSGLGIKKEKLNVVFDSFRKIENQSGKLHAGIGLGLSLVKGLVILMNGKIEIDSLSKADNIENQSGTTITIEFPEAIAGS